MYHRVQQEQTKEEEPSEKESPFTRHLKFLEEHPEIAFSASQNLPEDRSLAVCCICGDQSIYFALVSTCTCLYIYMLQVCRKSKGKRPWKGIWSCGVYPGYRLWMTKNYNFIL